MLSSRIPQITASLIGDVKGILWFHRWLLETICTLPKKYGQKNYPAIIQGYGTNMVYKCQFKSLQQYSISMSERVFFNVQEKYGVNSLCTRQQCWWNPQIYIPVTTVHIKEAEKHEIIVHTRWNVIR